MRSFIPTIGNVGIDIEHFGRRCGATAAGYDQCLGVIDGDCLSVVEN
jgi:hypothetical protein